MLNPESVADEGSMDIVDLERELCLIEVHGADATAFLQGQCCSDVAALNAQTAQLTAFSSPKGRTLFLGWIWRRAGEEARFRLLLPTALADAFLRRLRMYVLRSKVVLERSSARCLGHWSTTGTPVGTVSEHDGNEWLSLPGQRTLVADASGTTIEPPASAAIERWWLADIEAGVPVIAAPATQDAFIPQWLNLDLFGAISFTKGCYTGQEIVARMHYLGQNKRRLFRLTGNGPTPAPGTALHNAAGSTVGEIVLAMPHENGFVATAVLQWAQAQSALTVASEPASPVTVSAEDLQRFAEDGGSVARAP